MQRPWRTFVTTVLTGPFGQGKKVGEEGSVILAKDGATLH
jgi:hypothetical protein